MSVRAFISYSHKDAEALDLLHKHLAILRRENSILAWSDHEIIPGDAFGEKISQSLEECELFLALVSPDYLNSQYCYEKEFIRALELREAGRIHIVPIIVEECDWHHSSFGKFSALPKDGKAIASFPNKNTAYLEIVTGIRRVIGSGTIAGTSKIMPIFPAPIQSPVFLQCQPAFLPNALPAVGRVFAIELRWNPEVPHQGGQNRQFYGSVNKAVPWFTEGKANGVYECKIFNDGVTPLLNVFLSFEVEFRYFIENNDGGSIIGSSGNVAGKGNVNITADRIDPGKDDVFTFYMYNASSYFAEVTLPNSALINWSLRGSSDQKINVSSNIHDILHFAPFSYS